jgi:FG-GAP repeat
MKGAAAMASDQVRRLTSSLPLMLLLALPAHAGALEQKLTALDGAQAGAFGTSVAVEGDTAVVGAPGADADRGAVYVFGRIGDAWVQTAKLTASDGSDGDWLGYSVAIDGDTIVAGAPHDDAGATTDIGSVYTFSRTGPTTRTETAKLTAVLAAEQDQLGYSVAIDGDTIVAGAPNRDVGSCVDCGAVYEFATAGDAARLPEASMTASDGAADDGLGQAVGIDGDAVVAGAPAANIGLHADQGVVYTFARTGAAARQETAELRADDGYSMDTLGMSVAIEGDTIVAGAVCDALHVDQGAAYTFTRTGPALRHQSAKLTASDGDTLDRLGVSVAVDNGRIVAGAPYDDFDSNANVGSVYAFARAGAAARSELAKFAGSDEAAGDQLGSSVGVDGATLIAGAPDDKIDGVPGRGSATVFFEAAHSGDTGPGSDVTAPVLSRLRISPARIGRRGGRVSFVLSEPARVRFRVQRAGRRHHYASLKGALSRPGVAGANGFRFSGRLRGHALPPGRYRLVATPMDAARNTGAARSVRFTRTPLDRRRR